MKEKIKIGKKWDRMNKRWEQKIILKCLQDYEKMEWKRIDRFIQCGKKLWATASLLQRELFLKGIE